MRSSYRQQIVIEVSAQLMLVYKTSYGHILHFSDSIISFSSCENTLSEVSFHHDFLLKTTCVMGAQALIMAAHSMAQHVAKLVSEPTSLLMAHWC